MKKQDKILVTGAAGFIGSRLIKMLYENGYKNLRTTSYSRPLRDSYDGVEFIKGNLQDRTFESFKRCRCSIPLSATNNALDTKVNPLLH